MKLEKLEEGVYLLDSQILWPTLSIIGGIHGNESCGLELLEYIKNDFKLLKGKLFLITGNLNAISQNTRQCDVNLNRIFRDESTLDEQEKNSREYTHMKRIKRYLDQSDACLDIHSSPTQESPVFVICEKNCFSIVKNFPVEIICEWFAEVEPWGTDYYMYKKWKPGICIECGFHGDKNAFTHARNSLLYFLEYFWMIICRPRTRRMNKSIFLQAKRAYITKSDNYEPVKDFRDFEEIQKWQLIGYDYRKPVYARDTGYILFSRKRKQAWVEAFVELVKSFWEV